MLAKASSAEQGSHQWLVDRIGYTSSSVVAAVMAKGSGATRTNLMTKMLCEIMTGEPVVGFKSKNMEDGNKYEADSRRLYEIMTGSTVKEVGFHYIEKEKHGSSSDGLVEGTKGAIEIKNVIPSEQVRLITTGKIKPEYIKQMQDQMYVYELDWVDYVQTSFGDEELGTLPDKYQVKIIRVMRDEVMIAEIRKEVAFFHHDLQKLIKKLKGEE